MNPGQPDRMHFHSLFKRRYAARWLSDYSVGIRNSLSGVLVAGMTVTAVIAANLFYCHVALSAAAFAGLALGYVAFYARMVRHHWCSPIEFLQVKPERSARFSS